MSLQFTNGKYLLQDVYAVLLALKTKCAHFVTFSIALKLQAKKRKKIYNRIRVFNLSILRNLKEEI